MFLNIYIYRYIMGEEKGVDGYKNIHNYAVFFDFL